MPASRIGFLDLLLPQYMAGLQFPDYIHRYLSRLGVDELHTLYDDTSILYYGVASFEGDGSGNEVVHEDPSGANFSWDRKNISFRLTVPRDGAEFIDRAANSSSDGKLPQVSALLNALKPSSDADMDTAPLPVIDFPAVKYRLEILVDALSFTLSDDWKPGVLQSVDNRVKIDPLHANERVKLKLPKVLLSYSQDDNADNLNPQFKLEGWGIAGFDAPADIAMGELIRMSHPIAVHQSEHVAFSVDQIIVDLSENATPPELLNHFGVDEGWKGVFAKQILIYYSNDQGVGFNFRIKDALIGFDGVVSFEAALEIYPMLTVGTMTVVPRFFNGTDQVQVLSDGFIFDDSLTAAPSGDPPGRVTVKRGAAMQLDISGGTPPYTIQVSGGTDTWDNSNRQLIFNTVGDQNVFIRVTDAQTGINQRKVNNYYRVHVDALADTVIPPQGTSADNPASTEALQNLDPIDFKTNDADHEVQASEANGIVSLQVTKGNTPYTITVHNGSTVVGSSNSSSLQVNVPNNTTYQVTVHFPALAPASQVGSRTLKFPFAHPTDGEIDNYANESVTTSSATYNSNRTSFIASLPQTTGITAIAISGHASRENADNDAYDDPLSDRRVEVARRIIANHFPGIPVTANPGTGHRSPLPDESNVTSGNNRVAIVSFTSAPGISETTIKATLHRPAAPPPDPGNPTVIPGTVGTPPASRPFPNDMPPVIKQLGIRVKVERNKLSLLELYGKIDFETEMEKSIRTQDASSSSNNLDLQHGNAHDGEIDFKLGYLYDKALDETTVTFLLHSDERDTDGLLHMDNNANRDDRLKNIFGALLLFAPIINEAATAAGNNSKDAGAWVALGLSLGVPIAIGGLNVFRTRKIILYGGEAKTKFVTPKPGDPLRSFDFGLVFDYEVQFDIIIEALGIGQNRLPGAPTPLPPPLRARYKAIGFNLHYADLPASGTTPAYKGLTYSPVFDSSKGYDLDLSDPSLFSLPNPLGALFNIAAARLARFNPVTLEIDFAIKVDLGVITVDKFKLKIPLQPVGAPQIIPSGVRVNIPGVLVGSGFVEVIDRDIPIDPPVNGATTMHAKGVEGGIDLTLVALKVRVSANIGIGTLHEPVSGRDAISVFVGLRAEFPTPIVLFQTGLGIYGFMGLFAMNYKRIEPPADPTSAVGPALRWLINAKGDPTKLRNESTSTVQKNWEMALDRWSFGIGVILGTLDGGILLNLQGMLVLELPGPRILILVKMKIVSPLPSNPANPASNLEVGIIGVIDLDFNLNTLTLGVLVSYEIKSILNVSLPIELFFDLNNASNWHLWIGTIQNPASATILDIVRGSAYLMLQGNDLTYPTTSNIPQIMRGKTLHGIAVAAGLEASLVLGDEGAGVYLKISAGAHLGVSFSPFLVLGSMYFSGRLKLVVLSIGASGHFDIMVSQIPGTGENGIPADYKTYMHGEVCGSVDLFFFEISACVGITIGDEVFDFEAPPLVRGMYLQSFSPVIVSGQGSHKPIDASLGNAKDIGTATTVSDPNSLLVVPIDTVPVLQFHASPLLDSNFGSNSFIQSPGMISASNGKVVLSEDNSVTYTLKRVTLKEGNAAYTDPSGKPPSVWRTDRPKGGSVTDTSIDLAMFSRTPTATEHAVERSTDLKQNITIRWENACKKAAPPASVLYTFCGQHIGTSPNGWILNGIAKPDPADTVRAIPTNTSMKVYQPKSNVSDSTLGFVLNEMGIEYTAPARVVGIDLADLPMPAQDNKKCFNLVRDKQSFQSNPLLIENELRIYSAAEKNSFYKKASGFIQFDEFKAFESPYRTHFRSIQKSIGLSIREYMRIDVIQSPAQQVDLFFTSFNRACRLIATAFDEKGNEVDRKLFKHTKETARINHISLRAEAISYVIVANRNFTGQFVEICITRDSKHTNQNLDKYFRCFRSLQLPYQKKWENDREQIKDNKLPKELQDYLNRRKYYSEIIFETGACEHILCYAAVHRKVKQEIVVEELNKHNQVLKTYALTDLITKTVTNVLSDLPSDWLSANLPWRTQVIPTAMYLQSFYFNQYERIIFMLKDTDPECSKIRVSTFKAKINQPVMYVSAMEVLQQEEVSNQETMSGVLQTEQNTVNGYLNDHTPVPLMKPNTVYVMSVEYDVQKIRKGQTLAIEHHTQNFAFKTDSAAPKELKSYVLGATPEMDDRFHFYEDAVKVVFNDASFFAMLQKYGKTLRAVIRGADGLPVANSPETIYSLEAIPATQFSAYRDMIQSMIDAGFLPCMGELSLPSHAAYTTPFKLKPLMPYTLDIEFDETISIPSTQSQIPFYRRAFTTSRFANLHDFVKEIKQGPISHRALKQLITGLPSPSGSGISVHVIPDVDLEQALSAAGVIQKSALEQTTATLLWTAAAGDFTPYALFIESSEPIWRSRLEADKVPILNQQNIQVDPAFEVVQHVNKPAMLLQQHSGGNLVSHFVRSSGGTRTLVFFKTVNWSTAKVLHLELVQTASALFDLPEKKETIYQLSLNGTAPWEE